MFKEFAKGLSITFKHLLPGHSTTVQYPTVKLKPSDRFRGLHRLVPSQDREKCVACYLCPTVCPAKCITVESAENEKGEKYPKVYTIDMLRCIFCGLCVEACPTRALTMTNEYELADETRAKLIFEKDDLLAPLRAGMLMPPHPMYPDMTDTNYYNGDVKQSHPSQEGN